MSFLPHQPASVRAKRYARQKGFSLIELMMQLVILCSVILPMLMMMNVQRNEFLKNQRNTTDRIFADQLFDNVDIHMPDPVDFYAVGTYTAGANTYLYSVYCDPSTKLKDGATYSNVSGSKSCIDTTNGEQKKGPYFQRSLAWSANYQSIRVTISLYRQRVQGTQQPYLRLSRDYKVDGYRIQAGSAPYQDRYPILTDSYTYNQADTKSVIDYNVDQNNDGALWYPDRGNTTGSSATNDNYRIARSCGPNTNTSFNVTAPFARYETIGSGCNIKYYFKVVPFTAYYVNLYYQLPKTGITLGASCLTGSVNTSCALAQAKFDSLVTPNSNGSANTAFSQTSGVTDINLATGQEIVSSGTTPSDAKGMVVKRIYTTSPDATELLVTVGPPSGSSGSAYLSGIEILQKDQ